MSNLGRPTKYNEEVQAIAERYLEDCAKNKQLPFIEELALLLHVGDATITNWANDKNPDGSVKNEEFLATYKEIKTLQKLLLKRNGLKNMYNSKITALLLSSDHSTAEKTELEFKVVRGE